MWSPNINARPNIFSIWYKSRNVMALVSSDDTNVSGVVCFPEYYYSLHLINVAIRTAIVCLITCWILMENWKNSCCGYFKFLPVLDREFPI